MESLLIFRTGNLGDTICAVPAIKTVRDNFGECKLVLLANIHSNKTYAKAHEILLEYGLVDDYLTYYPSKILSPTAFLILRNQIKKQNITRMIYLPNGSRTLIQRVRDLIFFKSCGIKKIYGLRLNVSFQPLPRAHIIDDLMEILRSEGFKLPIETTLSLPVLEQVKSGVDRLWINLGLNGKKIIAIGCCSKMPIKRWGLDNYRVLGEKLIQQYGVHLLILGGKEDVDSADFLCKAWGGKGIHLAGKTSYAKSAEILRRCLLYLGNDTGVMHLAAAVGIPCIAIFSARDDRGVWDPYGKQHLVLRKDVECQGCMLTTECVEHNMKCIRDISIEEVLASFEKVFTPNLGVRLPE